MEFLIGYAVGGFTSGLFAWLSIREVIKCSVEIDEDEY